MIDISLFRNNVTLEQIRESERNRFRDPTVVDRVVKADSLWRQAVKDRSACSRIKNIIGRLIGQKKKAGLKKENTNSDDSSPNEEIEVPIKLMEMKINDIQKDTLEPLTVEQLKNYSQYITNLEKTFRKDEETNLDTRDSYLEMVGNILHPDVPISQTEDHNLIIKQHTAQQIYIDPEYQLQTHDVLLRRIGGVDLKAGQRVAGNRGYYLRGPAVYLAQALTQVSLKILGSRNYEPVQTPYFMRSDILDKVSQLNDFGDRLYRIDQGSSLHNNDETLENDRITTHLIATSEQPLVALHQDQKFGKSQLPIRYAGISTCFRTETGRHGQDTAGICRVHQFDKIEQFVLTDPNSNSEYNSNAMMDEMIVNCEELIQQLNISYRIVSIVSKELNLAASIKYDIEGMFPASSYRELVSCSNCTDYQARRINTQYADSTGPIDKYIHMLNSTMCAIPRMISALLESNQSSNGIIVPEILRPYMPEKYRELIEYIE